MTGSPRPHASPTPYQGHLSGLRCLTAGEIIELTRLRRNGVGVAFLASRFEVSRRTVYRWLAAEVVSVTVAGWTARFALRPSGDAHREGPVQLEDWRRP